MKDYRMVNVLHLLKQLHEFCSVVSVLKIGLLSASQDLMRVALVRYVKHDFILR